MKIKEGFVLRSVAGSHIVVPLGNQISNFGSIIKLTETGAFLWAQLESEKTSLEIEFERIISYSNIELEAAEIGMQKMDKSQVKYIRVNDKNTAVTKDGEMITSGNN